MRLLQNQFCTSIFIPYTASIHPWFCIPRIRSALCHVSCSEYLLHHCSVFWWYGVFRWLSHLLRYKLLCFNDYFICYAIIAWDFSWHFSSFSTLPRRSSWGSLLSVMFATILVCGVGYYLKLFILYGHTVLCFCGLVLFFLYFRGWYDGSLSSLFF